MRTISTASFPTRKTRVARRSKPTVRRPGPSVPPRSAFGEVREPHAGGFDALDIAAGALTAGLRGDVGVEVEQVRPGARPETDLNGHACRPPSGLRGALAGPKTPSRLECWALGRRGTPGSCRASSGQPPLPRGRGRASPPEAHR